VILKQFYLPCLAHASYLIGDESTHTAVIVDPQRDTDQYLAFAKEHSLKITHVFLTHLHADFVAGHLELRDRASATICLGAAAKAAYPFTPFADNQSLTLGKTRLQILQTPGHTPESISILLFDLAAANPTTPQAVLTGDTLFIGDVGRPDLRAALGFSANQLGALLYDSLHTKLLTLPDQTLVYPAHGAGSLCGKSLSKETVSTLGQQRLTNYALQPMTKDAFIQVVTADQPDAPAYFNYDAVLNAQEHPTLDQTLAREMNPLTLDALLDLQESGAQILDTRDPDEFAPAHLARSINIGLSGQFATWVGTLLHRDRPIVLIANPGRETEAATRLGRIGFDNLAGFLHHGLHALTPRPDLTSSIERISAPLAAELLASPNAPLLIDVRNPREYASKHIANSLHLPLNHLAEHLHDIPKDRPLLLHCAGGYRSSIASSLLQSHQFPEITELAGGLAAWEAAKLPIQTSP
jgi:rhodanese-related sulfurtransferase/glyoxylase-like metal-dependent hydrolase (beta-lactamase superfamily II)